MCNPPFGALRGVMTPSRIPPAVRAALILAQSLLAGAATAQAGPFVTAEGRRIELRPAAEMTCAELRAKLAEIDATGYRGMHPTPPDPRDAPLFDYERSVSEAFYGRCAEEGLGPLDRTQVFRQGFGG